MNEVLSAKFQLTDIPAIRKMLDGEIYLNMQILTILKEIRAQNGFSRIALIDYNTTTKEFIIRAAAGWDTEFISKGVYMDVHNKLLIQAVREKKTIYTPDVYKIEGYIPVETSTKSEVNIPLVNGNYVFGIFNVQATGADDFTPLKIKYLEGAAKEMGDAISNMKFIEIIKGNWNSNGRK